MRRVMLNLAGGMADRGVRVDLVLAKTTEQDLAEAPSGVRIVDLRARMAATSVGAFCRYLRRERPRAVLCAHDYANFVALWARRLAGVETRVYVTVHNTLSVMCGNSRSLRTRIIPSLVRTFFPWADGIIAVSRGVADDLIRLTGLPADSIRVIYNPVIRPEVFAGAGEAVDHPWFSGDQPPVVLSAGRLMPQKDYGTLILAFAAVREQRQARLVILGEGEDRAALLDLARQKGIAKDVSLPGFVSNPYAYMARAGVFALSSRWEGLPTVLVEALACGAPVVSTDCPSGPHELLQGGKYGRLVPVGDAQALAGAILATLDEPRPTGNESWAPFQQETSTAEYLGVLAGAGAIPTPNR